jgi:hypothetical protein
VPVLCYVWIMIFGLLTRTRALGVPSEPAIAPARAS